MKILRNYLQIGLWSALLVIAIIGVSIFDDMQPVAAQNTFTCAAVTEIPQSECVALVALYDNTDGTNWWRQTDWLQTDTPCRWHGVTCYAAHVTALSLSQNQLSGSIPPELGNLSHLQHLGLAINPMSGGIPPELGNLSNLSSLALVNSQLSGSIPSELGNLSNLTILALDNNQLSGSIPSELGNLSNLSRLALVNNQLSGDIPSELGNLSNLSRLALVNNQLSGSIPSELGNLSSLTEFNLSDNQLSGSIPSELGNLSNLTNLSLGGNQLSGSIPPELGNLSNMLSLDLTSNQLSGSIPSELGNLSNLSTLFLSNNHELREQLPMDMANLAGLHSFWFSNTSLCEPSDPTFQAWLSGIVILHSTERLCTPPQTLITFTDSGQLLGDLNSSAVVLGDLDGDGDLDAVIGNDGPNKIWQNDGDGNFIETIALGTSLFGSAVALGDLDGDGDLDALIGNGTGTGPIEVWLNNGQGTFSSGQHFSPGFGNRDVALGDLDGDGDLDALIGRWVRLIDRIGESSQIWLNDGQGTFSRGQGLGVADTNAVALGDLDGDGDLDAFLANEDENSIYLNEGQGTFSSTLQFTDIAPQESTSVALGDLDGDGDLDAVVGNVGSNQLLENEGGLRFRWRNSLGSSDNLFFGIALGDLDNDDDLDVFITNGDGRKQASEIWQNPGDWDFMRVATLGKLDSQAVALGDLDSDGNLDAFVANVGANTVWRNGLESVFAEPVSLGESGHTDAVLGDLDGDGDLDALFTNGAEPSFGIWQNNGGSDFIKASQFGPVTSYAAALGDLDGDADLDAFTAKTYGDQVNSVWRNNGGFNFTEVARLGDSASHIVELGDLDGDGDLDAIIGNFGPNRIWRNDGLFAFTEVASFDDAPTLGVAAGDLDGDGDLDVFTANTGVNRVWRNDDSFTFVEVAKLGVASSQAVALGDLEGDGDLDAFVANEGSDQVWLNQGSNLFIKSDSLGFSPSNAIALGDLNNDGALDAMIGEPSYIYLGTGGGATRFKIAVRKPGSTQNANFYSTPIILDSATIPINYTLFHPEGRSLGYIKAFYSLNGGDNWREAVPTAATITTNLAASPTGVPHTFVWDTFASNVFGQSDNVVIRLEVYPQPTHTSTLNTYQYTNETPGPYMWPYAAATTFPFRVRGTQVRVVNETGDPVQNALVYRLPAGQSTDGQLMGEQGAPFSTNAQGYLSGQGELKQGDQLVALWPATRADQYTLYHTSAAPTITGLNAFRVTQSGVQNLAVSAAHPLLLFDLKVSLQWDASNDPAFLAQLEANLARTSTALYDWTNGQVALGNVTVYQDRERWDEADIRIYASNQIRPTAHRGGIVSETMVLTDPAFSQPITVTQGEVRIGPVWNRYGDATTIGDDWPNVLAHELGHYALFLEDTYLGLDPHSGLLIAIDTCGGTAMTDPYEEISSELRFDDANWSAECGQTIAELPDWEMIRLIYPALHSPPPPNPGPTNMPFAFTQVEIKPPTASNPLLVDFNVALDGSNDQLGGGQVYLRHPNEQLIDLGRPIAGSVLARGAREGDELCIFGDQYFDCVTLSNNTPARFTPRSIWKAEVLLTPINTTTLQIQVNSSSNDPLQATFYPNGETPQTVSLTPGAAQTITLIQPAADVLVDIAGGQPHQRLVTGYTIGAGPGRRHSHGGPGRRHSHGGPFTSGDGSVVLYPPEDLPDDAVMVLQTATALPNVLPSGLVQIGRAYYVRASLLHNNFTGASLSFQYLGLDVTLANISGSPDEKESSLAVHFWNGNTWQRLDTVLNKTQNFASAAMPGPGLYVLTVGHMGPAVSAVSPDAGASGLSHTLTISGVNFLAPLTITLSSDAGSYPLTTASISPTQVVAETPIDLPASLYDLVIEHPGSVPDIYPNAFALRTARPTCFFDDFESGTGLWNIAGDWGIVTLNGDKVMSDSPNFPYRSADVGAEPMVTSLTSQPFSLSRCPEAALVFRHDQELIQGDQLAVEVSADAGASWQTLKTYKGRAAPIQAAMLDDEWKHAVWRTTEVDLTGLGADATIQVRFKLETDDFASARGAILDEVMVTPRPDLINDLLVAGEDTTSYDPTPVEHAPAGVFTIAAQFTNRSPMTIDHIFFRVTKLTNDNVILNADGTPDGVGSTISIHPDSLGENGLLDPGETFTALFKIGLTERKRFKISVDAYGVALETVVATSQTEPIHFSLTPPGSPEPDDQHSVYLPVFVR
ncbi:VCBS repeat-containing protein [Chloroflexi bacterium TSY]|nr:VCBS repeat-containing protein [Chloroflexi bacterium TSY]